MSTLELQKLKYPIGKFEFGKIYTSEQLSENIRIIKAFPSKLSQLVKGLNNVQLRTPYRPEGWTVQQVIHHVADSHINAYIRFKLTLTEEKPTIKPYEEARWAELPDGKDAPIVTSLSLLDNIHERWVMLLKSLDGKDWERTYFHPEHQKEFKLNDVLGMLPGTENIITSTSTSWEKE